MSMNALGAKKIVRAALLVFVLLSVAFLVMKEFRQGPEVSSPRVSQAIVPNVQAPAPEMTPKKDPQVSSHKVIVYYFHGTARCPSCRKIEAFSQEAVQSGFSQALKDGRLEWRVINVEEPGNEHFVQDYQLYTKSLVVVDMQDGRQTTWKNLERVWKLLGDKGAFMKYVEEEVRAYLEGD